MNEDEPILFTLRCQGCGIETTVFSDMVESGKAEHELYHRQELGDRGVVVITSTPITDIPSGPVGS